MSTQIQKPLNPPSLQIDDAEDSARQRFANYMRLQKRNARGDQTKKKGGCLLWHLKIWSRLAIPHPSCSVLIPTSLWVKSCDTTIIYVHDACSYRIVGALRLLGLVFS